MARKETTNTFSNGLIMDLNPINTPNTVLTDCLNGTIITYNGNEHILQNDMGNFKLNGCDLKKGYIPLGIKEYAGILYIVSYNPLTKTTEIGSYPSTLVPDDNIANSEIDIPGCIDLDATEDGKPTEYKYTEAIKACVVTPITPISDDTIINPGDQYTFNVIKTENQKNNAFQCFKYYILDKDKNLHDVTAKLPENVPEKSYVPFQIPGWLMIQNHIAEFNSFTLDIIKAEYPTFPNEKSEVTFTVRLMLTSYDNLITDNKTVEQDIGFNCEYANFTVKEESTIKVSDLYNGAKSYYKDITITGNYGKTLNFTATPKLRTIIYDNLTQTINYNYTETDSTSDDLSIGDNTWKYTTDKDNSVLSIWFDTSGINSLYNKSQLVLKYTIYNINKDPVKTGYQQSKDGNINGEDILYKDIEIDNWNKSGFTTMLNLPLCNYTEEYKDDNYLFPENIYIVQFKIYSGGTEVIKPINKLVVASELMNGFENQKLDDIPFDTWFNKFADSIKNKNFIVDAGQKISVNEDQVSVKLDTSTNFNIWKSTRNSSYPRFTQSFSGWNKDYTVTGEVDYSVNITYDTNVQLLSGPLWDNLLSNSYIYVNGNKLKINPCTGKWIPVNNTYKIIDSYKKSVVYSPVFLSSEMTVKEYSKRNLTNTNINFSVSAVENKIVSASGSNNNSRQTTFIINGDTLGNTSRLISTQSQINTTEDMTNISPLSTLKAKLSNTDYIYGYINMLTEKSPSKTYLTYLSANNQYEKSVNGEITIDSKSSNGEFSRIEYILLPNNVYYIVDYKQGTGWDGTKVSSINGVTASKDVAKLLNELVYYIDFDPVSTKGAFIQLSKKDSSISTGSSNINISGNIILNNEIMFNDTNLLYSDSRKLLADKLKIDSNINTTNITEVNSGILFNTNIELDTLSNPISVTIPDSKLQELDENLDNIDTEITNINIEIDSESKKCQNDKWFTYDGESGYYYESVEGTQFPQNITNTDIKNIVKILNKEVDSVPLSVRNHPSSCDEDKYNLGVKIGNITEYNIKSLNAS